MPEASFPFTRGKITRQNSSEKSHIPVTCFIQTSDVNKEVVAQNNLLSPGNEPKCINTPKVTHNRTHRHAMRILMRVDTRLSLLTIPPLDSLFECGKLWQHATECATSREEHGWRRIGPTRFPWLHRGTNVGMLHYKWTAKQIPCKHTVNVWTVCTLWVSVTALDWMGLLHFSTRRL